MVTHCLFPSCNVQGAGVYGATKALFTGLLRRIAEGWQLRMSRLQIVSCHPGVFQSKGASSRHVEKNVFNSDDQCKDSCLWDLSLLMSILNIDASDFACDLSCLPGSILVAWSVCVGPSGHQRPGSWPRDSEETGSVSQGWSSGIHCGEVRVLRGNDLLIHSICFIWVEMVMMRIDVCFSGIPPVLIGSITY